MKIVTHNSSFHSDDVFAVATLLILFPEGEVARTRDKDKIEAADYVVDVGMVNDPVLHRFDHHQPEGAGKRENGIPYASFGLVWKEFGEKLSGGKAEAEIVDTRLVQPLDAHDNGVVISESKYEHLRDYTIGDFLYSYLPRLHQTEEELYKIFMELTVFAKALILREIEKAKEVIKDERRVEELYEQSTDKRILVLPEELRWMRMTDRLPETLFVIHPRNDGNWSVKTVQDDKFNSRKTLPAAWAGMDHEKLQQLSGVSDAIFCHRALFMAAAVSQEGAIKLAEIALNS